jgi:hypothetical protein
MTLWGSGQKTPYQVAYVGNVERGIVTPAL